MEYESDILKRLIKTYGVVGNPRYNSEIIKEFIVRGKERFPELFTYQSDWLAHIDVFGLNPTYTVSYTGQSIYTPNTLERPVKSAILKGQTLINLYKADTTKTISDGSFYFVNAIPTSMFKSNTYTVINTTNKKISIAIRSMSSNAYIRNIEIDALTKIAVTLSNDEWIRFFIAFTSNGWVNGDANDESMLKKMVVIEGDYTNVNIPYFEGMQSVKMPVLKTTGKNLFDGELEYGIINSNTGGLGNNDNYVRSKNYISTSTYLTYSVINEDCRLAFYFYDNNKNYLSYQITPSTTGTIKPPSGARYLKFRTYKKDEDEKVTNNLNTQIQIEEGSQATPYEPYKSNILSCLEPVELGSVGEVKDELNLLTQQLTQRTETRPYQEGDELNSEFVTDMTNTRYKLAQEVVKTVDLTIHDKDHQKVERLTSFEGGTHFTTSSQDGTLLPTLAVDVVTDLEETLKVCSLEGNTL